MSKIGVRDAVLQQSAEDILRQNETVAQAIEQVISAINEAANNWEGKSQSVYLAKFEEIKPVITAQLQECLTGLANEMKHVSDSFVAADQLVASKIKL